MPIYEYKCTKGHVFEVMQSFADDPLKVCEVCGAPVQQVYHPVAIHFKGSGFHNTDYGTKKRARENAARESAGSSAEGGSSSGDGKSSEGKSGDGKSGDKKSGDSSKSEAKSPATKSD